VQIAICPVRSEHTMSKRATILTAAVLTATAAVLASCTPPHVDNPFDVALCARSPITGNVFQYNGPPNACGPGPVIIADILCGPLVHSTAEADVCVSYWRQRDGLLVVGPSSSLVPGDIRLAVSR
jgi:hypothetical protein